MAAKPASPPEFPVCQRDDVLAVLEVDDRKLREYTGRKVDPLPVLQRSKGGRGRQSLYDMRQVLQWAIREALRTGAGADVLNLDAERARLAAAQADERELKVAEMAGALVRRDDVEFASAHLFARVRSLLEAVPLLVRRHVPDISDDAVLRVTETVSQALHSLADLEFESPPAPDDDDKTSAAA